jgi:hypothetical protein
MYSGPWDAPARASPITPAGHAAVLRSAPSDGHNREATPFNGNAMRVDRAGPPVVRGAAAPRGQTAIDIVPSVAGRDRERRRET